MQIVRPRAHDLGGGFTVRRALPAESRRAVGPFVFWDHFGPVDAGPDDDHDVRPHPHIGLATVTYLYDGAILHRDSTGVVQRIAPGAVNWMIAGRGIVHSERTPDDLRGVRRRSHGLQLWVALPADREADAPSFQHVAAADVPQCEIGGATVRVLAGSAFGATSPVQVPSPTLLLDVAMQPGDAFPLPPCTEIAVYVVDGAATLDGDALPPQTMAVLDAGEAAAEPLLAATAAAHVVVVGGDPVGPRHLWWNFVASDRAAIDRAADDWAAGRFDAVPGDSESIPLPERRPT